MTPTPPTDRRRKALRRLERGAASLTRIARERREYRELRLTLADAAAYAAERAAAQGGAS